MGRTCSKLAASNSLQIIAKTEYEHNSRPTGSEAEALTTGAEIKITLCYLCIKLVLQTCSKLALQGGGAICHGELVANAFCKRVGASCNGELATSLTRQICYDKGISSQNQTCCKLTCFSGLTYSEIFSKVRADNNRTWRIAPIYDWYRQKHPGAALELKGDRKLQSTITRFISGHTRTLSDVQGQKIFPVCFKFNTHQFTPEHLLSCMGLEEPLFECPALVCDFLWASGLLDLV
ncbi:hypothetical protein AVEN_100514-1 [Araneus ventricosus]|uniref:Uncharacterized protein n=1 Tax=Araneus ventricosus TaxID=182803 RepID=A0A4Y2RHZ0_ARAVE|nr:hypothetical protein AVEN_100514-1 [Araneus ventricosus]